MRKHVVQEFGYNVDGKAVPESYFGCGSIPPYARCRVWKASTDEYFLSEATARFHTLLNLLGDYRFPDTHTTATEILHTDLGKKLYEILGEFYD